MKKKVWILNHYAGGMHYDNGGRHYSFAKYLKKDGYSPVVFGANSYHGNGEVFIESINLYCEKENENIGVPFVFVKARPYRNNGKARILNMIDFYRNMIKTGKKYAKQNGSPDIIYASSVHLLTLVAGLKLAKFFGVKCVCEVRDFWPESFIAYGIIKEKSALIRILRHFEKRIYKKADSLIITCPGGYDYIIERGWDKQISRDKVFYLNNGVDLELFEYNKNNNTIVDDDLENQSIFKVIYTGSIRSVNNVGIILDVAKLLVEEKVLFLIWGAGDKTDELCSRIEQEGIRNVVYKGKVEKKFIPFIISKADLNLMHNTNSSILRFGISMNKLFEYFAAGQPILIDFTCGYNLVTEYNAGVGTSGVSIEEIASQIKKIMSLDKKEITTMKQGAKKAAEVFDFKELTKKLELILER